MIKVSDYIAQTLVKHGVRQVFMVTGGGAMHLNDSLGKNPQLRYLCSHHEQASAMGAEGYARTAGKMAALCVTTGPGGTNALTGVYGAWTDSMPMIVISGQVRYDTTVRSTGLPMRQLGDQEFDITKAVATMTKYAVMVTDAQEIRYHLEKAIYLAQAGRPGPCWVDVPHNIQGSFVDETSLRGCSPEEDAKEVPPPVSPALARSVLGQIEAAQRPVLLVGPAVRSSGSLDAFHELIELLNIPVVTAFNAHDAIESSHRLYCGRPGTIGERPGNFAVQNSDLLLVLGCRLDIRQIGYNYQSFARAAKKIVVDIDPLELKKPTIAPDCPIHADVADFIAALLSAMGGKPLAASDTWLDWCRERVARYPVVLPEYWNRGHLVNPYCFVEELGRHLPEGQIVVCGDATACIVPFQALPMKKGQRLFSNSGSAPMGFDVPAAIGAAVAAEGQSVVCLAGDGSLQMNIQELQTIVHHQFPIKLFVLNNDGYHSIRQTQSNFFGKPLVGCDSASGVSIPDMERIAYAYKIPFVRCAKHADMSAAIEATLSGPGPRMCEMMLTLDQPFSPKASSRKLADGRMVSKPLEDLFPFLDRDEFRQNMLIEPIPEPEG
jgi:acetolactate synthase I/II/III large subunit